MDVDPKALEQAAPGVLGALGALLLMRGPWPMRFGMVIPGVALSYYGADWVAKSSGMPVGLSGFVSGLLGMILFGKIVGTWQDLELGTILTQWLRKKFGLQGGDQ